MSFTLKQIEAFYWIATLGSFVDAAERLSLAQSTISKRVLELEAYLGRPLLDRAAQPVRPTRAGANLVTLAAEMLSLATRFRETASGPLAFSGAFRFGVTELVALTWLPALVVAVKERFPLLVPEPEVDASVHLFERLAQRELHLVIGLDPPARADFVPISLGSVSLEWMCAPNVGPGKGVVPLAELAKYPILTQSEASGLQRLVLEWLTANGMRLNRIVKCNSLNVLAGLAAAGLGVTFLTGQYFQQEIASGILRIIKTEPAIPPIQYFAVYRADNIDPLGSTIAHLARECCDFSTRQIGGQLRSEQIDHGAPPVTRALARRSRALKR